MSKEIVSSLTDADLEDLYQRRPHGDVLVYSRFLANTAAQKAIEEFMVIAKKREEKLIKAAYNQGLCDGAGSGSDTLDYVIASVYQETGIEELKP